MFSRSLGSRPPQPVVAPRAAASGAERRFFLAASCAALATPLLPPAAAPLRAEERPPAPDSPAAALAALYAGNRRFTEGKSQNHHRDLERVRQVADGQKPFAAFLGCADSRVPIEIVFDQGFGDLFVTRIAGNVASSENIGSLEFGTLVLRAKVLFVLGHTACGAVQATAMGQEVPGQISGLFQHIRPAVKAARGDVATAIRENVKIQAQTLAESSPVLAKMVRQGELIVAGGVYDLGTGQVTPVPIPGL